MLLNVNPTRMELINLKTKLIMARRGHKLLKDKLDELVRVFMELIEDLKKQRMTTDELLQSSLKSFVKTKASSLPEVLDASYKVPWKKCNISKEITHLVGIKVFNYKTFLEENSETKDFQFKFFNLSKDFQQTIKTQSNLLLDMVKLAEIEFKVNILGLEIEKTRRRVNALEYTMIPNILETIRYITNKIEETDRGTLVRIMKVKDIVRAK
jgi:V/A-type H+-transporting ATPase subunit D